MQYQPCGTAYEARLSLIPSDYVRLESAGSSFSAVKAFAVVSSAVAIILNAG